MHDADKVSEPRRMDPCSCGSGKRYKHCHGTYPKILPFSPALELLKCRIEGDISRRKDFEGKGKGFVTAINADGTRFVAVRNRMMYGRWKLVTDFLMSYLSILLGGDWGNSELAKPSECRHPLLNTYQMVCKLQAEQRVLEDGMFELPITGAVSSYLGLAYNLYCVDHNALVHDRLLQRLKDKDQFENTRYEILIAGAFTRAGFEVIHEDEDDGTTTHYEFVAIHNRTKKCFSVECKRKNASDPKDLTRIGRLLLRALSKHAEHERIVFIDLNYPDMIASVDHFPSWMEHAVKMVHRAERTNKNVDDLPSATVILTNNPNDIFPDKVKHGLAAIRTGFKKPEIRHGRLATLRQMIIARDDNVEVYELLQSLERHSNLPTTFDGSVLDLQGKPLKKRLLIGNRYTLNDDQVGTLIRGSVIEESQQAFCIFQLENGEQRSLFCTITPDEIAAFKAHPESFFGMLQPSERPLKDPLDYYDFHLNALSGMSRDKLLQLMISWPAYLDLHSKSKEELASMLAEHQTEQILRHIGIFQRPLKARQSD